MPGQRINLKIEQYLSTAAVQAGRRRTQIQKLNGGVDRRESGKVGDAKAAHKRRRNKLKIANLNQMAKSGGQKAKQKAVSRAGEQRRGDTL